MSYTPTSVSVISSIGTKVPGRQIPQSTPRDKKYKTQKAPKSFRRPRKNRFIDSTMAIRIVVVI